MTDKAAPKRPDSCPSCRSNQPATRLTAYCDEYCGGFIHPCPDPWHKTAAEPAPLTAEENQDDGRAVQGNQKYIDDNRVPAGRDCGTPNRSDSEVAPPLTEAPQPELDDEGYPYETTLEAIAKWDCAKHPFSELLTYVSKVWWMPDFGWQEKDEVDEFHGKVRRYYLSTGGWSGNEDLIASLEKAWMFWAMCWVQSRRGGHYIFEVRS